MKHFWIANDEVHAASQILSKEEFARLLYLKFLYPNARCYYISSAEVAIAWKSCHPYPSKAYLDLQQKERA